MRIVSIGGCLEVFDQIIALVIGETPADAPRACLVVRKPMPCVAVADSGCIKDDRVGSSGLREAELLWIVFDASDQELHGPRFAQKDKDAWYRPIVQERRRRPDSNKRSCLVAAGRRD